MDSVDRTQLIAGLQQVMGLLTEAPSCGTCPSCVKIGETNWECQRNPDLEFATTPKWCCLQHPALAGKERACVNIDLAVTGHDDVIAQLDPIVERLDKLASRYD